MWVNLSTSARNYLNTYAFIMCLELHILRIEEKQKHENKRKEKEHKEFYKNFEINMNLKQQMRLQGLSDEEMDRED